MSNKVIAKKVIKKRVNNPSIQINQEVTNITGNEGVVTMENQVNTTNIVTDLTDELTMQTSNEDTPIQLGEETALEENSEMDLSKNDANQAISEAPTLLTIVEVTEDELQKKVEQEEQEKVDSSTETATDEKANPETASSELPPKTELETTKEEEDSTAQLPKLATNGSKEEQQPEEPSLDDTTESNESTVSVEIATITSKKVEPDSLEQDDTLLDEAVATTPNTTTHRQMNAPLTVVNHKNGKRNKIGKDVCKKLDLAEGDQVDVFVKENSVLICKSLNNQGHTLNKGNIIYNKELVEMITEACQFDFEGCSSNSLTQVKYVQSQGRLVAVLTKGGDM